MISNGVHRLWSKNSDLALRIMTSMTNISKEYRDIRIRDEQYTNTEEELVDYSKSKIHPENIRPLSYR